MVSMSKYMYLLRVISNMHADWSKRSSHLHEYVKVKPRIKADFMTL